MCAGGKTMCAGGIKMCADGLLMCAGGQLHLKNVRCRECLPIFLFLVCAGGLRHAVCPDIPSSTHLTIPVSLQRTSKLLPFASSHIFVTTNPSTSHNSMRLPSIAHSGPASSLQHTSNSLIAISLRAIIYARIKISCT